MRRLISLCALSKRGLIISNTFRQVIQPYLERGITPYKINDGNCEDVAVEVQKLLPSFNLLDVQIESFQSPHGDDFEQPFNVGMLKRYWNISPPKGLTWDDLNQIDFVGHVWIADPVERRHYDAEAPNGVASFFDLPFNQFRIKQYLRAKNSRRKRK